ncbi:WecB/TagA/CpsF family glycosyltransferase [Thermotalea metallivorans]|uniref:N-acetylglucosaminyldiphosphoundecaprenol N-acetyl-beta-D-mannosaminyltransferase n=1 Tax=Thermotalea metallivorans TaxID=520762 RepID=A0A140L1M1_9FIRM|nr:WecB/TagA/CpsF family glycosyltransferase [Thermotalea metallivorans]KXG74446.1 putative N-acetylmannosaminyltransferase [Thermotalea metallivorans]
MRQQVKIMHVPIDQVTLETAFYAFQRFMDGTSCRMIVTPNTEIVMEAQKDPDLLEIMKEADLVIPDGIGLIYASKIQGTGLRERVTGVDLMYRILEYCHENHKKIYLLGGKPGVAALAGQNIRNKFPHIAVAGTQDGYFQREEEGRIVEEINRSGAEILFVALGAPKQEKWIHRHKTLLQVKVAMGVGGSIDIWAGTAKRAPVIYQKLGLEWFYRLMKEPWRYKRMMALPKFMVKVLLGKK